MEPIDTSILASIVVVLVSVIKQLLPVRLEKYCGLISIILGVSFVFLKYGCTGDNAITGVIIGLTASGLWSTGKATIIGKT